MFTETKGAGHDGMGELGGRDGKGVEAGETTGWSEGLDVNVVLLRGSYLRQGGVD